MASSSIRRAIGAVKDQTSISIAKVAGTVAPDVEVLLVKATSHDEDPTDEKHIGEILKLTSCSRGYVTAFVTAISKRLSKTHDWIVALKALILVHRVLIDGHFSFEEEIVHANRNGMRILNLSNFRDEAHSNSWDHSCFVRFYATYLEEKVESMVYVKKSKGIYAKFDDDSGDNFEYGRSRRSKLYNNANESVVETPLKDLRPERVLEKLNQLLCILDRVLACRLTGKAKTSRLAIVALYLVVKESFGFYVQISEALGVLLDRFTDLDFDARAKAFDGYVTSAMKIDELVGFYNWSKDMGIARSSEFPDVQRIPNDLLKMLEGFVKKIKTEPEESEKRKKERVEAEEEHEQDMNEIKALPPPQNYSHRPPPPFVPPATVEHPQKRTEDLVNLEEEEDGISASEQGNKLALALFSGSWVPTANPDGSWVSFSSNSEPEISSAWETPAAETGNADWELALVESVSNLSKQKAELGGGFDPLLLSGMYDQGSVRLHFSGSVRQHFSATQLSGGSASSLAQLHSWSSTPMLALPAPDATVLPARQHDPFAASLSVPPPSYVQMAEMEKKQQCLLQEQLIWQQYGREGMQGLVGLAKIGDGSANYGFSPHQIGGRTGRPGGHYYAPD